MAPTRRSLLVSATAAATAPRFPARAQAPAIKIGVLNDMSGPYRDASGPTSAACVRQAVEEFRAARGGFEVEVVAADHQNKPDVGSNIARQWIDRDGVDLIVDVGNSAVALAVNGICREKDRAYVNSTAGSTDLTGPQCSPTLVHWTYDNYMLSRSTGGAMVKAGGDTWFFITSDYAFGHQIERDATQFVQQAGGRVLGAVRYPFPQTTDFSSQMLQAQASGAKVLALANAGNDTVNCVKQAQEFGLGRRGVRVALMLAYLTDIHTMGLQTAQGLVLAESFYWDLNDRTRAFMDRVRGSLAGRGPNQMNAGGYAATLHYLKAVADMSAARAKASGLEAVQRMKAKPTDDDCFGRGSIRADGRKMHPAYLFEVKKPAESTAPFDYYRLIGTTAAEDAFRPMAAGGCPLVV